MEIVLIKGELDFLSDLDGGGDVVEVTTEINSLGVVWMLGTEAVGNLSSSEVVVLEEGDAVLFAPGLVSFLDDLEVGEIIIVTGRFHSDISFFFSTLKFLALIPGVVECHSGGSLAFIG